MDDKQATRLRESFRTSQVGKLPRVTCRDCAANKTARHCAKHELAKCAVCGNYMTTAHMHLDFIGHAATTDRLLQVDPEWTWTPVAHDEQGLPRRDEHGGLWINLTVAGVTRLGYGDAGSKTGPNAVKEAIGDAIRNAAMRFGVALDLWAKEDLQADESADKSPRGASRSPARASTPAAPTAPATPPADEQAEHDRAHDMLGTADLKVPPKARGVINADQVQKMWTMARGYKLSDDQIRDIIRKFGGVESSKAIPKRKFDAVLKEIGLSGTGRIA